MYKINSFIITFCTAVTLSTPAFSSDCSQLNDAMKKAYDNSNQMAVDQVEVIMTKPDLSSLESCLGGLSGSLGSFSLPGIPDLNDLLNEACEAVVDAVYEKAMDGIGDDLKAIDMTVYRTDESSIRMNDPKVTIEKPDIDLHKSIENIFN